MTAAAVRARRLRHLALCLLPAPTLAPAATVELLPGDLPRSPGAYTAMSIQYGHADLRGPYRDGETDHSREASGRDVQLSLTHTGSMGDFPYLVAASLSHVTQSVRVTPLPGMTIRQRVSGMDDLRLAAGFWPWRSDDGRTNWQSGLVVSLPTGQYRAGRALNPGENRYRYTLVNAFNHRFETGVTLDAFFLYNIYDDNDRDGDGRSVGRRDDTQSLAAYLSYRTSPATEVFVGTEFVRGDSHYLDDLETFQGQRDVRGYLGGHLYTSRRDRLSLRLGKTLAIESGNDNHFQLILKWGHQF